MVCFTALKRCSIVLVVIAKPLLLCCIDISFLFVQEHGFSQPFLVKDTSSLRFR